MRDVRVLSNIVLMGFMGTGKTSVGRKLADHLNMPFVDSDQEIEKVMDMSVNDVFEKFGETRFRSEENLVIKKLAARKGTILSTGGGAVVDPDNLQMLKKNGVLVTLEADPEIIAVRVKKNPRPKLRKVRSIEEIANLLAERQFAYRQGDLVIDTGNKSVDEVVESIVSWLKEKRYGEIKG